MPDFGFSFIIKILTHRSVLFAGIFLAAVAFLSYQHLRIESLKKDVKIEQNNRIKLQGALDDQEKTINTLKEHNENQIRLIGELNNKYDDIEEMTDDINNTLGKYRNRLDAVAEKRPELISEKATNAFQDILEELGN